MLCIDRRLLDIDENYIYVWRNRRLVALTETVVTKMETEIKLPKEVYEELEIKEREEFRKEVKVIFDKKQAMIRFPTVLNEDLSLTEGDKFLLTVDKSFGKVKIICELVKGKTNE